MIEILNSNLKKLDILRKYTFSQYENKAREIGTFKVYAQVEDENLYLLDKSQTYYVLFDGKIFGKIENVKYDSDSEFDRTIELSGRLAPYIFKKRVIKGTLSYSGNIPGYIKTMVEQNITNASDTKRRIAMAVNYTDQDVLLAVSSSVSKQVTGGYLWDEIEPVLEQDSLCLQLIPVVEPAKIVNGVETNITSWNLNISAGVDRRKRNSEGNEAVVFSQSLSNIVGVEYENTIEEYCGVAYVAGEGEAEERKWYEVYASEEEEELSGWNRNELWVDARDIQSETSDGTQISDEEYQKLISQRASEKFAENNSGESYESTVTEGNRQYVYGVDYQIGDFVTVIDDELKITVDAQVTSVTVSEEGSQRITDVSFSYGRIRRDPVEKIKQIGDTSTDNANSVKYLEEIIKKTITGPNSTLTEMAESLTELDTQVSKTTINVRGVQGSRFGLIKSFVDAIFTASGNGAFIHVPFKINFTAAEASPTGTTGWSNGFVIVQNANYDYSDIGWGMAYNTYAGLMFFNIVYDEETQVVSYKRTKLA